MHSTTFDVQKIRRDFPLLQQTINDNPLIYVDNAATTQKPQAVIDAMSHYYQMDNANVHRSVHGLSARATLQFEDTRSKVARFINAPSAQHCIFVRGTTDAINLVAYSYVAENISPGDEILISHLEHHANIVPWQILCQRTGAVLKVAAISLKGEIDLDDFAEKLNPKTKFVALSYASNALGTINPIKDMTAMAHAVGAKVLIDGAQATAHLPIDVQDLNCDFFAFSAHKMFGPTGVGVLFGKMELLENMIPYQAGGEMINTVSFAATEYAPVPYKFEAGTPNIAGVIGFGAAIDYLDRLDTNATVAYEKYLLNYATNGLQQLKGYRLIGTAKNKVPVLSFIHASIHAHDLGTILDSAGVAVRSGHHCAMPLMDFYEVAATTRISLAFYNTVAEVDKCLEILTKAEEIFA